MNRYDSFLSAAARVMQESAIRRMGAVLGKGPDVISFAPGYPDPSTFPWEHFRATAADLLSGADGSVLQYGPTRGFKPLLGAISEILESRGIAATPDELLVTTGSQQGLDLVARVLIDPGDVVLVELPSYVGALSAFNNVQAALVGVRQKADGIDLDHLDEVVGRLRGEGRRARILYVVPNFQNPTGLLIGKEKRTRLLEWAERNDFLIVEDDPYRDLYFDAVGEPDIRPIKADDRNGRVVYMSSFSKTLAPGFRVAWVAAPAPLAAKFEQAKQAEDLCTGGFDQRMVYEAYRRGWLTRQIPMLRRHYQHKRDVMAAALDRELGNRDQFSTAERRLLPLGDPPGARDRRRDARGRAAPRSRLRRRFRLLRRRIGTQHAAPVLSPLLRRNVSTRASAGWLLRSGKPWSSLGRQRLPRHVPSGASGGSRDNPTPRRPTHRISRQRSRQD